MNITEEKTGALTATLKMEVAEADYAEKYQKELKDHRRKASLPGFRPGKVPMGIIQKKYGFAVIMDEVNKLVSEGLNNYIKENKLNLLGQPLPNSEKEAQDFIRQKDFEFYFDIAYAPELDLKLDEYEPVDYFKIQVDEKKLNAQIEDIKTKSGKLVEQEEVGEDDMIHVSIAELDEKGELVQDGITNTTMILAKYLKKQDIRDQVLGMKVGDTVDFNPLEASESEAETASMLGIEKDKAAEITQNFRFEITKIERQLPAEMGEELYKTAFPKEEIASEEDFKNRVKEEMEKAYARESEKLFSRFAMDKIFADTPIELPDEFLKKWLFASNEGKISMDEIEKSYAGYQKAMKMEIIENNLIKKNATLRVSEDDLKAEIKNYFKGYFLPSQNQGAEDDEAMNQQLDQIAANYLEKNKEESNRIHDELFSGRLAGYLKSEMKINEKEISYQAFIDEIEKITNRDHDHKHDHDHEHENEIEQEAKQDDEKQ